jgi:hypothetical protein
MHLDDGGVHLDSFDLDTHDLFPLQALEDMVQNTVLGPAIHAGIDGVPRAEFFRQSAPLAALFGYIEHRRSPPTNKIPKVSISVNTP